MQRATRRRAAQALRHRRSTCAGRSAPSTPPSSRWWRSPAPSRSTPGSSSWTSRPARSTSARSRCCSRRSAGCGRSGVAVIFVSHKLDELYAVCDRVTIMRDGRTVAVAPMAEMTRAAAGRGHARPRPRRGQPPGGDGLQRRRAQDRRAAARGRGAPGRPAGARRQPRGAQGRDRRPRRPARLGPHRDGARDLRRRPQGWWRGRAWPVRPPAFAAAGRRDRRRHRLLLRGPQGRGHRPRHVGAREPDAGAAAAPVAPRHRRRDAPARDRRPLHQAAGRQVQRARSSGSASCPAATSRRCCWRAGSA